MAQKLEDGTARVSSITEWELWACTLQVMKSHGNCAPAFIELQLRDLRAKGDRAGLAVWRAIGHRVLDLMDAKVETRH